MTVNPLWTLRDWFTVEQAASYLSTLIHGRVDPSDILALALQGQLTLSVHLPATGRARCWDGAQGEDGIEGRPAREQHIEGLWDLCMTGAGRVEIESWFAQSERRGPIRVDGTVGAMVERSAVRCQLTPVPEDMGSYPMAGSAFPRGSVVVVRRSVLTDFAERLPSGSTPDASDPLDSPVETRERATLLTIIAALADAAKIDISKPSKAAGSIEVMISGLGAKVSARTVEDHLKRIPRALERKKI